MNKLTSLLLPLLIVFIIASVAPQAKNVNDPLNKVDAYTEATTLEELEWRRAKGW
jgi:hypothetical protein